MMVRGAVVLFGEVGQDGGLIDLVNGLIDEGIGKVGVIGG